MCAHKGNGTYKCERGSDYCDNNEVLWMMKEHAVWYAFDAPKNGPIPTSVPHDKVIFISAGADADLQGWHKWTMTKSNNDQGSFQTTHIAD